MSDEQQATSTHLPVEYTPEQTKRLKVIRQKAFRALDGNLGDRKFRARLIHRKLLDMRPNQYSVFFYETLIATAVVGKIKPAKTHQRLVELRNWQKKAGKEEEHAAFEARLLNFLGGIMVTQHGYDVKDFKTLDHDEVWDNVSKLMSKLEQMGYKSFLNSGTLLGVVRDKRLIDHDDDVDLGVVLHATNAEDVAQEWTSLSRSLSIEENVKKTRAPATLPIVVHQENSCKIDLFPCWMEGDSVYIYPHTFGELSKADVLPLKTCDVSGQPIPAEPEKMLEVNYGKKWKIPDPDFKFRWWRAGKLFKSLKQALGDVK